MVLSQGGPGPADGERIEGGQPGADAVTCPGRSRWDKAGGAELGGAGGEGEGRVGSVSASGAVSQGGRRCHLLWLWPVGQGRGPGQACPERLLFRLWLLCSVSQYFLSHPIGQRPADPDVLPTSDLGQVQTQLVPANQITPVRFDQNPQRTTHG